MSETMRVRAKAVGFGGIPGARRRVGEVFDVPKLRADGKPNTSSWYVPVDAAVPLGKPAPKAQKLDFVKVGGEIVPAIKAGVSGGTQPKDSSDLI